MAAIRWDNVNAPDFTGAAAIMGQAQNSLNRGLGALGGIVQDGAQRRDDRIAADSGLFMEAVRSQFKTPEAMREAQASGALDQLRGQFKQLDPTKTGFAAVDGIIGQAQDRTRSDLAYNDSQRRETTRGAQEEFDTLVAKGDLVGAGQFLETADLYSDSSAMQSLANASKQAMYDSQNQYDRSETIRLRKKQENLTDAQLAASTAERERLKGMREAGRAQFLALEADQQRYSTDVQKIEEEAVDLFGGFAKYTDQDVLDAADDETKQQIAILQGELDKVRPAITATDAKNMFTSRLVHDFDATPGEAQEVASGLENVRAAGMAASAVDMQEVDARLSNINSQFKNNPIVADKIAGKSPDTMAQEVYDSISPELKKNLGKHDIREVVKVLSQVASGGYQYQGKKVPVSKSLLKFALENTDNAGFLWSDDKLSDALDMVIKRDNWIPVIDQALEYDQLTANLKNSIKTSTYNPQAVMGLYSQIDVAGSDARIKAKQQAERDATAKQLADEAKRAQVSRYSIREGF